MKLLFRRFGPISTFVVAMIALVLNMVPAESQTSTPQLNAVLSDSWNAYKKRFIQDDGRVIDRAANDITTSEGQSYGMLRACWMSDRECFDRVWSWTKTNLRREDQLFRWKWGKQTDGSWGIIGEDSATDADQDIALALIMASRKWKDSGYLNEASVVLDAIWDKETLVINKKRYLLPGNWAASMPRPKLNPSYFAPYAYRIFAAVDTKHDWNELVETSYAILEASCSLSRLGLPPDWVLIDPADSKLALENETTSDYSYDAMRVPWRMALDWKWNREERAMSMLKRMSFLHDSWALTRTIRITYSASGVMKSFDEPRAGFGCVLPMFGILYPADAQALLQERIMAYYYDGLWSPPDDYYAQNWVWFGIGAYTDSLTKPAI